MGRNKWFPLFSRKNKRYNISRKRGQNLHLTMNEKEILLHDPVTFLGLTFDKRLTWLPHLKNLKASCLKSINILKVLNGKNNGADRQSLINIYKAKIRSKLDYASIIYSSANSNHLSILNPVHNLALRICTGSYRTCPVETLYCETGEFSLENRRNLLCLKYFLKILAYPTHLNTVLLTYPNIYRGTQNRETITSKFPIYV